MKIWIKNITISLIASTACIMTTSCAVVKSSVTSFYQQPLPSDSGKTFFVAPLKAGLSASPEFFHYAGIVAENLEKKGFRLVGKDSKQRADYMIVLAYGIDSGTPMTYSVPVFGSTGGGSTAYSGVFNSSTMTMGGGQSRTSGTYQGSAYSAPSFGVVGEDIETRKIYDRYFFMAFVDTSKTTDNHLEISYEARARSSGSSGEIAEVLPKMITATFKNFPGKSGKTRHFDSRF